MYVYSAYLTYARPLHTDGILIGVGSSDNYAYLVIDDKSKDAVIIDPANPEEYGLSITIDGCEQIC